MRRPRGRVGSALVAVAALAVVGGGLAAAVPQAVRTEDEANVSLSPGVWSDGAQIVVTRDGTVHAVWEEGFDIVHRRRDPRAGWSDPGVVFYGGSQPALTTDGDRVAVAFVRDASRQGPEDRPAVYVRLWDEAADAWSTLGPAVDLSEDGSQPDLAFSPVDGALFVAWADHTYDTGRPYLARMVGETVMSAGKCGNFEVAMAPSLAVDNEGTVYVARTDLLEEGEEPQVVYARRPHGGASCIGDEGPPAYDARVPRIAIQGDDFCLVWQQELDAGNVDVVMGCRIVGGWLAPNMSNSADSESVAPRLALDAIMGALVVWQEAQRPGDVLFRQNPPPPESGQPVSPPESDAGAPDLYYRDGYAHAVWTEWRAPADSDVHYARWPVEVPTATPTITATPSVTATPTATAIEPTATPTPGVEAGFLFIPLAESAR